MAEMTTIDERKKQKNVKLFRFLDIALGRSIHFLCCRAFILYFGHLDDKIFIEEEQNNCGREARGTVSGK